jgi:phytanoyl-CoA hydroxylase
MLDSIDLDAGKLPQRVVDQYWNDGFIFPVQAMSGEKADHYRAQLQAIEGHWLDNGLRLPLTTYKRVNSNCVMPMAWDIAADPAVLDVVQGILGPDIMVYAAEFFIKEAHTPQIVSMHQDLTYWGLGAIDGLVTAWIALSPATPASGCMDFVRASHKNPILPHNDTFDDNNLLSRGQEVAVDVADADKVAIQLQPGQMSLHHGLTIHGSGPNVSDDRRIGIVVRYCRPDIAQTAGDIDYATLVRGTDRHHNFRAVTRPSSDFSPESLDLYDQVRAEQAKVMMKGAAKKPVFYANTKTTPGTI